MLGSLVAVSGTILPMATDRGKFTPESALQQSEQLKWKEPTTAQAIFACNEPNEPVGLASAPFHIGSKRIDNSTIEYVVAIDRPLDGNKFLWFLSETAPYPRFNDSPKDVIADWKLYDDPTQIDRQKRHDKLGPPMATFKYYRRIFMQSIQNYQNLDLYERNKNFKYVKGKTINEVEHSLQFATYWPNELTVYSKEFVEKFGEFLKSGPYAHLDFDHPFGNMGDEGRIMAFKTNKHGDFFETERVKNEILRAFFDSLIDKELRNLLLTLDANFGLGIIAPVIHWQKTTKSDGTTLRQVNLAPLNVADKENIDTKVANSAHQLQGLLHYNPLVGLLAVKYLLPKVGQLWQEKMPIPEDESLATNIMAEQAVLVLSAMMVDQTLQSDFFPMVEELGDKGKAN